MSSRHIAMVGKRIGVNMNKGRKLVIVNVVAILIAISGVVSLVIDEIT